MRGIGLIVGLQVAGLVVATWPAVLSFRTSVPCNIDVFQHLWILHWYKTCLLEGRSVVFCPELQYPVGAPLGYFSPLHLQALLFFPLSIFTNNDTFCWNTICAAGVLFTGPATSLLAWRLVRDRACAAFAGLATILSFPLMTHALCHLELVYAGGFPLFLLAWMRLIDHPGPRRVLAAALAYLLVAMCAAYYMVYAIVPAALYLAWRMSWVRRDAMKCWLTGRLPWLLGTVLLTVPGLLILYYGSFWAIAHGFPMERSRGAFGALYTTLWSYVTPTPRHWLGRLLPSRPYETAGVASLVGSAYLGIVPAALIAYAAVCRAGLRRASFVWSGFALMVVLALGASWKIAGWNVPLPASWLRASFPLMRLTRDPSRFNMFAIVFSGVLAASGLRHLLARLPNPTVRLAVFGALAALVVLDLRTISPWRTPLPEPPGCYAFIKKLDPKSTLLELPDTYSGTHLGALCTYWQSQHHLATSVGYSGHDNSRLFERVHINVPFFQGYLADPHFLDSPGNLSFGLVADVDLKDYLWLYLTVNRFDYLVLHAPAEPAPLPSPPAQLERIKTLLEDCKVFEDGRSIVYARARLNPPTRAAPFLGMWSGTSVFGPHWACVLPSAARIALYNPSPDMDVRLSFQFASPTVPLSVRLLSDTAELARWEVVPGADRDCLTPALRLPAGLQYLTIEHERRSADTTNSRPRNHPPDQPNRLVLRRLGIAGPEDPRPLAVDEPKDAPREDTKVR
jgi:hypothetical protein